MKSWFLITLLFLSGNLLAQVISPRISAEYSNTPFSEVVADLESKYPVSFFFDPIWADSLFITLKAEQIDLESFLEQLFEETELQYYVAEGDKIILTRGQGIITHISQNYFSHEESQYQPPADYGFFDYAEDQTPSGVNINEENTVFEIGDKLLRDQGNTANISGYVRDARTGEPLIGALVFQNEPFVGTSTDGFGYYVISLPKGSHELLFRSVGMKETKRQLILHSDGSINLEMSEDIISLKEVVVLGERNSVEDIQTGMFKLDRATLKAMPTILGDADVMKIALTLPGVQSVGEGASGFNVRGGATDQNLILVNDVVVFNPTHLFGFFSAFNPDAIKSADLYKSGIQAHYGGRVSSVFDVAVRDGNKKEFTLSGGISPITARVTAEGPFKKDKTSYLLGIRSTYSDWILRLLDDPAFQNSKAFFADIIAKVDHQIDNRNSLTFSAYHSRDEFKLNSDSVYEYYNSNASVQWRHSINNRLFSTVSGSYARYAYAITSEKSLTNSFVQDYSINNVNIKAAFDWLPRNHNVKFGFSTIYHDLSPGTIQPNGEESVISPVKLDQEQGLESALYVGDEFELSNQLSIYGGLRFSHFALLGPGKVFQYQEGVPREKGSITDTVTYSSGQTIKSYYGPEFRLSGRYKLGPDVSLKLSYDRTRQYIHQLSNTTAISPTDIWRLSNTYIQPQIGDQISVGLYKNFDLKGIETSVEGYYKEMENLLEYKDGANLLINDLIETDVIRAFGKSYGAEFLFRKKSGKLNGWVSYTYSRVLIRSNDVFEEEDINNGNFFPSSYDKPHNLSVVTNYKVNRRVNFSFNFVYSTGRPVTVPITKYEFKGNAYAYFPERNQLRVPDYLRLDLAINLEGNHRVHKLIHGSWSFAVYNLTGRDNVYSVFFKTDDGGISINKLSIFAEPIPTITYNFKI